MVHLIRVCLAFVCACKPDGTRDVIRRPRRPHPAQTLITDEDEEDEEEEDETGGRRQLAVSRFNSWRRRNGAGEGQQKDGERGRRECCEEGTREGDTW